jgi:uncharacterized protein (DUF305 family)
MLLVRKIGMKNLTGIIAAATIMMAAPLLAQHQGHQMPAANPHAGHAMPSSKPPSGLPVSEASKAFASANAKMHKDMMIVLSGNADVDFAKGMIPHHQGAIDMAEIVLKYGKDAEVKKLANTVIAAQKTEIAQMTSWLQKTSATGPSSEAAKKAYADVNARMHSDMTIPFSSNPDVDFMKGMIPHHEGAVAMAKVLLEYGKDAELRKLADDIIRSQNDEVIMMRGWLKKAGAV